MVLFSESVADLSNFRGTADMLKRKKSSNNVFL